MHGLGLLLRQGLTYRGGLYQLSWVAHRIAGLGTLLFLTIHIVDTSLVFFAPELYNHAIQLYRNPFFGIGEVILVGCVLWHGLNGLRIAVSDWFPHLWSPQTQRPMLTAVVVAFLVLYIPVAAYMLVTIVARGFMGG
jgi:succinate dehydrogenase / fumarate reductase cytochrome b subunit